MKRILIAALMLIAVSAHAATFKDAIGLGAGAQVVWFNSHVFNYDTEAAGKAAFSVTPHISLVGSAGYGLGQKYGRAKAGARFTVTDANDPNFSVGVGFERQWWSKDSFGASEWVSDVSVGWKTLPWAVLTAQGAYGVTSKEVVTAVGLTVPFKLVKGGS
jgi:hypothetical protein